LISDLLERIFQVSREIDITVGCQPWSGGRKEGRARSRQENNEPDSEPAVSLGSTSRCKSIHIIALFDPALQGMFK